MNEEPSAENDATCGKHFGRHPDRPELVAICTRPAGHDGDCDNVLPKSGASSADHDAGICGRPRRYFSQQTCELPFGHDGEHEDATHIWSNP